MQNRNRTARYIEKDPDRVLRELQDYAATHSAFAEKMRARGVDFTPDWLQQEASTRAFRGLLGLRRFFPGIAGRAIIAHKRAIVSVYSLLKDVVVEK